MLSSLLVHYLKHRMSTSCRHSMFQPLQLDVNCHFLIPRIYATRQHRHHAVHVLGFLIKPQVGPLPTNSCFLSAVSVLHFMLSQKSFLPLLCCGLIRLFGLPQGFRQDWLACCYTWPEKVDDGNDNDEEEDALAVLVLHRVVDVPPALQSEFVSQLRPPVSALDHCLHLQNTNDIKTSNIKKKEIYSTWAPKLKKLAPLWCIERVLKMK